MKALFLKILMLLVSITLIQQTAIAQFIDSKFLTQENISNFSIDQTSDGYITVGTIANPNGGHDIKVINFDPTGTPMWSKVIDGGRVDRAAHVQALTNSFIITGFSREAGGKNNLIFIQLDLNGNIALNKRYFDNNRRDWSLTGQYVLELDNNQGYLLTGYSIKEGFLLGSNKSAFVMRIDDNANVVWAKYYDSPNDGDSDFDMANFALKLNDGFFITGSANVYKPGGASNQGVLSMKIDDHGSIDWNNNFAIDDGEVWEENLDVGTSALLDDAQIVLSSNSTLSHSFHLTKIDPNNGSIVGNHYNFVPTDEINTASFSIGKNSSGNYIVGGMIAESGTSYDCFDNITEWSSVSFVCDIDSDLDILHSAKKFLMYNENFNDGEGSVYHSLFGGPSGLDNPVIATPEMIFVDDNSDDVAILAYSEDRLLGAGHYDLQYIETTAPDFDWCRTRSIEFTPQIVNAIYDQNVQDNDVNDIIEDDGFTIADDNDLFTNCQTATNFPFIDETIVGENNVFAISGRCLHYSKDNTYVMAKRNSDAECASGDPGLPYIKKYDANGGLAWQKATTTTAQPMNAGTGIEVDNSGNVYLSGGLNPGNIQWPEAPSITAPVPAPPHSSRTAYLLKYDANGTYQWQSVGFPDPSISGAQYNIQDYEIGPDGYLYVVGVTSGAVSFQNAIGIGTPHSNDPYMPTGVTYMQTSNGGGLDHRGFIAKYNPANGRLVFFWSDVSNSTGLMDGFIASRISIHSTSGNLYVSGNRQSKFQILEFTDVGVFVSKVETISGYGTIATSDLLGDNLYIAGTSSGSINFNTGISHTSSSPFEFVAKIDYSLLTPAFVKSTSIATSPGDNARISDILAIPGTEEIFVLGNTKANITQYNNAAISYTKPTGAGSAIFLSKYDKDLDNTIYTTNGWPAHYTGPTTNTLAGSLDLDEENCGVVYSGSYSTGTIDLGYGIHGIPTSTTCATAADFFVARALPVDGAAYKTSPNTGGDEEQSVNSELSIYPNPAGSEFTISGLSATDEVVLINSFGQAVDNYRAVNRTLTIKRHGLSSGVYFLKITGQRENKTIKLILK